jgi:hypothetical protein
MSAVADSDVLVRLLDIALDQSAGVEVDPQRSTSRSETTSEEALRWALARLGAPWPRPRRGYDPTLRDQLA